jgi:hypothetical protein
VRLYGGHDYYDCVLGYGADPTVVLVRKNEAIDPELVSTPKYVNIELHDGNVRRYYGGGSDNMQRLCVVFCDKLYYGVEIVHEGSVFYFWQADKLQAWVDAQKDITVKVSYYHWSDGKRKYTLQDYFEVRPASEELRNFMITNRYAIILKRQIRGDRFPECIMNPHGLKKYGFAKAIDPYTAYQELSMWVGGVLAGESPKMVKITDDKVLIENHGFDKVFSFRGPRLK